MTTVYVIMATQGEWEDRRQWPVGVITRKQTADNRVARLNNESQPASFDGPVRYYAVKVPSGSVSK